MGRVAVAIAALFAWLGLLLFCSLGPPAGGTLGMLGIAGCPLGMAFTAFALFGGKEERRDLRTGYGSEARRPDEDSHILGSGRPRRRL